MRRSAQHLGPLVIAFLLGACLVAASAQSYRDARLAAHLVAERQGVALMFKVRGSLPAGIPRADDLRKELDANRTAGLTYIGILEHGVIVSSAGEPLLSDMEPEVGSPAFGKQRVRVASPGVGRETAAGPPGPGDAKAQPRPLSRPSKRVSSGTFPLSPFVMPRNMLRTEREFSQFVMEFVPPGGGDIIRRATIVLLLCCGTALFLVAAAVVLWRSARRNEEVTQRLTTQNHLARLGEMSAVLAHELRNPLAALKGHAQLQGRSTTSPNPSRARRRCARSSRELSSGIAPSTLAGAKGNLGGATTWAGIES